MFRINFQDLGQSFAQYQFQDLGQLSTPNVIPSHESNSILNGNIGLVFKESKFCDAIEEECSVHQQTPSVERKRVKNTLKLSEIAQIYP